MVKYNRKLNFINNYFLVLSYELMSWLKYIQTDRRETKWSYNKFYYKLLLEHFYSSSELLFDGAYKVITLYIPVSMNCSII